MELNPEVEAICEVRCKPNPKEANRWGRARLAPLDRDCLGEN
jgi:hypothetical protein